MTIRNPWLGAALAWAGFIGFAALVKMGVAPLVAERPWIGQAALKLGLIVAVAALARAQGLSAESLGLRGARTAGGWRVWGTGVALGAAGSLLALLTGATGMASMMKNFPFPHIVLWVWIVSSVSEEIFCRGWFQGQLALAAAGADAEARFRRVVVPSGVLFGAMHLTLWWAGAGVGTTILIVSFATALGLVCAHVRERTGSLYPAIAAHVGFNVGGLIGGIIYTIGYRLATGQLPLPPG